VLAVVVVGAGTGVTGAGVAAAQPVSTTLQYSCVFPVIGAEPITVHLTADIPGSQTVGVPTRPFPVNAVAVVNTDLTGGLRFLGVQMVEGTAVGSLNVTAPQGTTPATIPFAIPRTAVPAGGSLSVPVTGTAPSLTFTQPGSAKISAGNINLHLIPEDANGSQILLGPMDLPCTLNGGRNTLIASFDIQSPLTATSPAPTTTAPRTTAPAGGGGGTTTSPAGASASGTSTGGASPAAGPTQTGAPVTDSPTAATATAISSPSVGGVPLSRAKPGGTMESVLLTAGGGVAVAAVLAHGWRRTRRRQAGGRGFVTVSGLEEPPQRDR
jgi:hypothetical protein